MFGRSDFAAVQDRWSDYWAGRNQGPLYAIALPKNGVACAPKPPWHAWFNGGWQAAADAVCRWADSCEFYGDAIPIFPMSFGPDTFAAFCGADLAVGPSGDTTWPSHPLKALGGAKIAFDPNSIWWGRMLEYHHVLKAALGDAVLLSAPTVSAGLDGLVGLYGNTNLLLSMVDEPELVREALAQVNEAYTQAYNACARLFEYDKYGCGIRLGMYSRGPIGVPQCDVSCMISSEMFEEFAVPCLRHEMDSLGAAVYHLDGPDALRHLERLAHMPEIRAIQWVAGAGEAATRDWTPLRKRILSQGKGLLLHGDAGRVAELRKALPSKDIFFEVQGLKTRAQAEDFLAAMEQIR